MKFIVDLWLDGYNSEEEMNIACKEFIREQLDFTASSVQIEEYDESRESKSAVPSEDKIKNCNHRYLPTNENLQSVNQRRCCLCGHTIN